MALEEVVPTVAQTKTGQQPGRAVGRDLPRQRVGPHGEVLVHLHQAQVLAADAGDLDRLLHRGMGLTGGVDRQTAVAALRVAGESGGALAAASTAVNTALLKPCPG
jgi:hypothetical protein